jgi:hypothetical protein
MEMKTLKATPKETKHHIWNVELQGLPNLIWKKNDEKLEIQLKDVQWCGCHLQQKKNTRKGQLSYKQCKIELGWKKDHPKDCFNKCQ